MHLVRGPELEVPAGFVVLSIEVLVRAWWMASVRGDSRPPGPRPRPASPAGHRVCLPFGVGSMPVQSRQDG